MNTITTSMIVTKLSALRYIQDMQLGNESMAVNVKVDKILRSFASAISRKLLNDRDACIPCLLHYRVAKDNRLSKVPQSVSSRTSSVHGLNVPLWLPTYIGEELGSNDYTVLTRVCSAIINIVSEGIKGGSKVALTGVGTFSLLNYTLVDGIREYNPLVNIVTPRGIYTNVIKELSDLSKGNNITNRNRISKCPSSELKLAQFVNKQSRMERK